MHTTLKNIDTRSISNLFLNFRSDHKRFIVFCCTIWLCHRNCRLRIRPHFLVSILILCMDTLRVLMSFRYSSLYPLQYCILWLHHYCMQQQRTCHYCLLLNWRLQCECHQKSLRFLTYLEGNRYDWS